MRILICDDARDCVERLQRYVGQYMRRHGVGAEFVATTDSAAAAADERLYDLAFLDVEMEPVGGIEIAKRLKQRNDRVVIFLVTAYDAYLDAAMDLHVFRFFEKPFDEQRLYAGLDRAMEYIDKSSVDVFLRSDGRYLRVFADDILFVKTENRRTYVQTLDAEYVTRGNIDEWCERLPKTFFYPVHKSYLVNLHYVTEYSYQALCVQGAYRIPIASRRQAVFRKHWFLYLQRR